MDVKCSQRYLPSFVASHYVEGTRELPSQCCCCCCTVIILLQALGQTISRQRMNQAELVPESFSVWIPIKDIAILFSRGRASIALHEISSSSLTHSRQLLDANSHTVSSSHTRNKPRSKPCWDAHPITRRPTRDICRPRRSRPPKELAVREAPVAASVLGIDRCSGAGQDYSCRLWKLPDFVRDK